MFDTKDILGFLLLLGGLIMATNISLVNERPKPPTNLAEKKSQTLWLEPFGLDESLENSMLNADLAQLPTQNFDGKEDNVSEFLARPRRVQKVSLNGN